MKINTGYFRVCKQNVGNSIIIQFELKNRDEALEKMRKIGDYLNWEYYCEEEVVFMGTQFDSNNNLIDSLPNWVRI